MLWCTGRQLTKGYPHACPCTDCQYHKVRQAMCFQTDVNQTSCGGDSEFCVGGYEKIAVGRPLDREIEDERYFRLLHNTTCNQNLSSHQYLANIICQLQSNPHPSTSPPAPIVNCGDHCSYVRGSLFTSCDPRFCHL